MSESDWHIRVGQPTDRALLTSFTCADPAAGYEIEVEQFIQNQLIDWAFAPKAAIDDPRLLLAAATATGEPFGVAAHERVTLQRPDGAPFSATKIEVEEMSSPYPGYRRIVTP
jgi:hypothetical protein